LSRRAKRSTALGRAQAQIAGRSSTRAQRRSADDERQPLARVQLIWRLFAAPALAMSSPS
jgi:hypothetical protein